MDLWFPPEDQAPLMEWWSPLLLASAAARRDEVPWPIRIEDFMLMGRVDRGARPAIWIYKHRESRRELNLDATGQAYKFTTTPNAKAYGRFTPCHIRAAVHRADLPSFVPPVWYDQPPSRSPGGTEWWGDDPALTASPEAGRSEAGGEDDGRRRRRPRPGVRRGHLTVIEGGAGRPMAG